MDIRRYSDLVKHTSSGTKSTDVTSIRFESELNSHDNDGDIPGPSKRACTESNRKYDEKWEKTFQWLHYDEAIDGAFCSVCQNGLIQPQQQRVREVSGLTSLSPIGKRQSKR